MTGISLSGVDKRFGNENALRACDLEIHDHEFLVLVGPSGSGKTTLLRIIAGLEDATAGDLYFGERLVNDLDVGNRDIAMVFQNYGLYPHMSVYKNMAFGLRKRHVPRPEIDRKVHDTAAMLGIDHLLERKPRQLSGGQRQRVALGRAIVRDPAVFLLDEPLSNLDAHLRVQMRAEILKVHRAVTATAVYVTHDQIEALTMGDRIAVMNDGRIYQVGTPEELYDRPVNRFVAGFIGTPAMGFLHVAREAGGAGVAGGARSSGDAQLRGTGVRLRPSSDLAGALPGDADRLTLGMRPEHLRLISLTAAEEEESVVEGVVSVVEPLGSEQHVVVDTGGDTITARLPRQEHVRINEKVAFAVDTSQIHAFDPASGLAYR